MNIIFLILNIHLKINNLNGLLIQVNYLIPSYTQFESINKNKTIKYLNQFKLKIKLNNKKSSYPKKIQ